MVAVSGKPFPERTCARCYEVFRTWWTAERVYCLSCRSRYGYAGPGVRVAASPSRSAEVRDA